jgi:hypothetical protein
MDSQKGLLFLWGRRLNLVHRRTVWCPTWLGTLCIALFLVIPMFWWCVSGESFLSLTERTPAEVLVVEGWIGREGMRAAALEFAQRGYRYIVAAGGQNSDRSKEDPSSYAEMAARELIQSGIPKGKIIVAPARDAQTQRTYESAVGVWRTLRAKGIQPKSLNVFTYGPHARRSRLVFSKIYGPQTEVGVISWVPSDTETVPWWRSSERAREMITETVGYLFEALLNSGRRSNSPG